MAGKGWTDPSCNNNNCQINLGRTDPPRRGTDHRQYVYVMHCPKCVRNYGANGSDIKGRRCPYNQGGALGLLLERDEPDWRPDSVPECPSTSVLRQTS